MTVYHTLYTIPSSLILTHITSTCIVTPIDKLRLIRKGPDRLGNSLQKSFIKLCSLLAGTAAAGPHPNGVPFLKYTDSQIINQAALMY